jgi:hypothetical protein
MRGRNISYEWVERTARAPEWREPDPNDPAVERRFCVMSEFGNRILRVETTQAFAL